MKVASIGSIKMFGIVEDDLGRYVPDTVDAILMQSLLDHFGLKNGQTFAVIWYDESFLSVPNTDATVSASCALVNWMIKMLRNEKVLLLPSTCNEVTPAWVQIKVDALIRLHGPIHGK